MACSASATRSVRGGAAGRTSIAWRQASTAPTSRSSLAAALGDAALLRRTMSATHQEASAQPSTSRLAVVAPRADTTAAGAWASSNQCSTCSPPAPVSRLQRRSTRSQRCLRTGAVTAEEPPAEGEVGAASVVWAASAPSPMAWTRLNSTTWGDLAPPGSALETPRLERSMAASRAMSSLVAAWQATTDRTASTPPAAANAARSCLVAVRGSSAPRTGTTTSGQGA